MRILLDENMPHSILDFLREEGHVADSVNTLRLKGMQNGRLYREIAQEYDLFFTRDAGFVKAIRSMNIKSRCVTLRMLLPQLPKDRFLPLFKKYFKPTDWKQFQDGDDWPQNFTPS